MILNIDNIDQLDLLIGLVSNERRVLLDFIRNKLYDDSTEARNVLADINDLNILLDKLENLKDMIDNKEG